MRTSKHTKKTLTQATGEELLLLTVFGSPTLQRAVDRELDRRASFDRAHKIATHPLTTAA